MQPDSWQNGRIHRPGICSTTGFQHRRLQRALDLVLLTAEDARDHLLPAGNRREPLTSLRRADCVLLREEECDRLRQVVRLHSAAELWVIRRELIVQQKLARPFCFCGIARPDSFFAMVRQAGYTPSGTMVFPDHHGYSSDDVRRLVEGAVAVDADGFYLTRKDVVKLPREWVQHLQRVGSVHAPLLRVSFLEEARVSERLAAVFAS